MATSEEVAAVLADYLDGTYDEDLTAWCAAETLDDRGTGALSLSLSRATLTGTQFEEYEIVIEKVANGSV